MSLSKFFLFLLILPLPLFCGMVRLFNDSPYTLVAVIQGSDGTKLGSVELKPSNFSSWSDNYQQFGMYSGPGPSRSQTPYTVLWTCQNGDDYSINVNVSTGGTVTASSGEGARICKPVKKKKEGQNGQNGDQNSE
ncbi:MAG: hypothetical protein L0207_03850 [Chlamydiae bacterium]|nr:hypothetical protein [Chlamydiota bacterium]